MAIKEGVDKVVREFASNTFRHIATLQLINSKSTGYNPRSAIVRFFKCFSEAIDLCIQSIAGDHLVVEQLNWGIKQGIRIVPE